MHAATNPVVFGYFTTALVATAAVAFAAGVQFLLFGLRREAGRTSLSFALLCFGAATLALGRVALYAASSLEQAATALHVVAGAALVALPALVLFVGHYTARPVPRPLLGSVSLLSLALFVFNLLASGSVLNRGPQAAAPLRLPWGETLYTVVVQRSVFGHLFYALCYVVFAWALYRALRQYRDGQRLRGALLAACLLLQLLAALWTGIALDTLNLPYPPIDAFVFLSFVCLMSLSLVGQMHRHAAALERTADELREEAIVRRQAELELRHAAWHDVLTGLPNRLRAQHLLGSLIADAESRGHHGAVLLIDLDNFKTINDALGHHVGDRVLEELADRLLNAVPDGATVARLGGDEFAILLDPAAADAAAADAHGLQLAERLLDRLESPLSIESRVLAIGASAGVASYPAPGEPAADIIRRADIALYRAKAAGRHTVRAFQPRMQSEADTRLELERGLRLALERDELVLHYQPQVDMAGHLLGVEALLRWQHPQLGTVQPASFIPVAEETGLIHALGQWAVAATCRQLEQWRALGVAPGLRVSVNVSPWQLAHPRFVDDIAAQVEAAGLPPAALTLELTESALLKDFDAARHSLRRLSALGFRLSLDDFGTGYSSLAYLQRLPLDELKIDRSFIHGLQPDGINPLVGFIVDVGQRLGMDVVAEGVETAQQKAILGVLGCDLIQGHVISPPLPAARFLHWLRERGSEDPAVALGSG